MKKIISLVLFLSCLTPAFAFTDKRLVSFKKAERFYGKGKYYFAILKYQRFISLVKDKEKLKTYLDESQYKLSMSYLEINAVQDATQSLKKYLKNYPAGKHIKEVKLALKKLDPENKSAKESPPKAQKSAEEVEEMKEKGTGARPKDLLKQLSAKYDEKPERIDEITRNIMTLLKEKGIAETHLRIMEGMNTLPSFPPLPNSSRYANCAVLYTAFRYQGNSHEESIYCIQEGIMGLQKADSK